MEKRIRQVNPRLLIGILLVVGGFLSLLDVMGVITNAGGIFWGLVFGVGGLAFLYLLFNDQTNNCWAAFPGFTLLGLAVSSGGKLADWRGIGASLFHPNFFI